MISAENARKANGLLDQIDAVGKLMPEYHRAAEVMIAIPQQAVGMRDYRAEIRVTAEEIGQVVSAILNKRLAAIEDELKGLGIEPPARQPIADKPVAERAQPDKYEMLRQSAKRPHVARG